jgi:hypothetical protein
MALRGKGILIVFAAARARDERDLDEWYNREHIDERIALPGFSRARRYVAATGNAAEGEPKYLATYECDKVGDLAAPRYLKRLATPTTWTSRVTGRFTKFHRMTMRIRVDLTHGIGGAVTCLRFVPDPAKARALAQWLKITAFPAAIARPGMVGAFAAENDAAVASAHDRGTGASPPAAPPEWLVMLEGGDARATAAAARAVLPRKALAPFGLAAAPIIGTYRFVFGNER